VTGWGIMLIYGVHWCASTLRYGLGLDQLKQISQPLMS